MAKGNLLEAANICGLHGYTLVPRAKIDDLKARFGLEAEEELGELFEVDPLIPVVQLDLDDVRAMIDNLEDPHSNGTVQELLTEALEIAEKNG